MNHANDKSKEPENAKRIAWWKYVVSLLLLVHVSAVFAPPFFRATQTPLGARSPVATEMHSLLEPYINLMFLDHGYAFFAPGPGPSRLIRFRVEYDDGTPAVEHVFPDLQRHWPRLLYHRHFMLAEQLHGDYVTPIPPDRPERGADEHPASRITAAARRSILVIACFLSSRLFHDVVQRPERRVDGWRDRRARQTVARGELLEEGAG